MTVEFRRNLTHWVRLQRNSTILWLINPNTNFQDEVQPSSASECCVQRPDQRNNRARGLGMSMDFSNASAVEHTSVGGSVTGRTGAQGAQGR